MLKNNDLHKNCQLTVCWWTNQLISFSSASFLHSQAYLHSPVSALEKALAAKMTMLPQGRKCSGLFVFLNQSQSLWAAFYQDAVTVPFWNSNMQTVKEKKNDSWNDRHRWQPTSGESDWLYVDAQQKLNIVTQDSAQLILFKLHTKCKHNRPCCWISSTLHCLPLHWLHRDEALWQFYEYERNTQKFKYASSFSWQIT